MEQRDRLEETGSYRRQRDEEPPRPAPMKDVVLPLAVVIGLIGNAWWGGVGWGQVSTKLDSIMDRIGSTQSQVTQLRTDVDALDRRLLAMERDLKAQADQFRLFKMYTKGRIARLPYRATDDGE